MSAAAFVKTGPAASVAMFEAEAAGLREIAATQTVRVPDVYDVGVRGDTAYIEMEHLELVAMQRADESVLGEQLAAMHGHSRPRFGWQRDNTIGLTPQPNGECELWLEFYRSRRLQHQLQLAAENGYAGELQSLGESLLQQLPDILSGHSPEASLLHGDLWAGNRAATAQGPVIFDPAVYFGDRETDLAMTQLFGGFSAAFYQAYTDVWPLADGHEQRTALYQLYHVLNHLNLFGSGYLSQSLSLMRRLLAAA